MPSLRDIRSRIASVKNTRQITSAMKMVSAAKLRRATEAATQARPYQVALSRTLQRVAARAGDVSHPLLESRETVKKVVVVVYTSDRGLCGGFNANLNRRTDEFLKKLRAEGKDVTVRVFGKKGRDFLRQRGYELEGVVTDVAPLQFQAQAQALADFLAAGFQEGTFDEAYLAYNQYKSALNQVPTFARVLPLSLESSGAEQSELATDFIFEPSATAILGALLPMYLQTLLMQALLETSAGFYAAQMAAMDNATRNASDLISRLTVEYNRGRQAAITKELIEIISGAEAL